MTDLRKIAVDRGTTLSGLIRDYLVKVIGGRGSSETKQRELEALERSFKKFHYRLGRRSWQREDLYERH